jgi:hypothetical protein
MISKSQNVWATTLSTARLIVLSPLKTGMTTLTRGRIDKSALSMGTDQEKNYISKAANAICRSRQTSFWGITIGVCGCYSEVPIQPTSRHAQNMGLYWSRYKSGIHQTIIRRCAGDEKQLEFRPVFQIVRRSLKKRLVNHKYTL